MVLCAWPVSVAAEATLLTFVWKRSIKNQTRWVQHPAKIQQVGAQNPPSWGPKSSKIGPGGSLGRLWAPSWPKLAPRAKKNPKIHQKSTKNGPNLEAKIHQKSCQRRSKMWSVLWWFWEWLFRASCGQVGTNLGAKTLPKLSQVWFKIEPNWSMVVEATFWRTSARFFMISRPNTT